MDRSRLPPLPRSRHAWAWPILIVLTLSGSADLAAQEFSADERITAIDLVVSAPQSIEARDITVRHDGQSRPVLAIDRDEPWTLVVYFDRRLTRPSTLRWAADLLNSRAETLTDLGTVQLMVANEFAARTVLSTRDPQALRNRLAALAFEPESRQAIADLRGELLAALAEEAFDAASMPAVIAEEQAEIERRRDLMLLTLVEAPPPTARRALLLVSDGYDLRPDDFYGDLLETPTLPTLAQEGAATAQLGRLLAAYGWTVLALTPEAAKPDKRWGLLRSIEVRLDRNWNPEKARAFHELGNSLQAQGKLADAEDAYRKAVYHFYGQPKLATEEARSLAALGEVQRKRGEAEKARRSLRQALALDPSLGQRFPHLSGSLVAPTAPLATLAEATGGRLVRVAPAFDDALRKLEDRLRVTYQVAGPATGRILPVTVDFRGRARGGAIKGPRWVRSGSPAPVTEGRLRRTLRAGAEAGGVQLTRDGHRWVMTLTEGTGPPRGSNLRLSAARWVAPPHPLGSGTSEILFHRQVSSDPEGPWSFDLPDSFTTGSVAVVLEDLDSGWWANAAKIP